MRVDKEETVVGVDALLAREAIKVVKARYFRCLDGKDWAGLESLFAPDASFDMREARGSQADPEAWHQGAPAIAGFVRQSVDKLVTVHHGHMPEIEVTSDTTARGIWAMEDFLLVPAGVDMPFKQLRGYGHYHDTYECLAGDWKIKSCKLTRLHVDVIL